MRRLKEKSPTISLVHKGTLRRVWDALPNSNRFGITRVHTPDVLIVPPVPDPKEKGFFRIKIYYLLLNLSSIRFKRDLGN